MLICPKCSRVYDDSWKVCQDCRVSLDFKEGNLLSPLPAPKINWKKDICIFLIVFSVLALLFWGLCGRFWR